MAASAFVIPVPGQLFEEKQTCFCVYWYRRANRGLLKLLHYQAQCASKKGFVCGAEIVQFVGNRWKRNIPWTQSHARAVSSSGGVSVTELSFDTPLALGGSEVPPIRLLQLSGFSWWRLDRANHARGVKPWCLFA